ncbi:protein PMR5-like [Mercurialis annua]|uniref:protein PMR5-like n=1 Tax=Mercurialis annua TaxID=3986 RepID=UPI00215E2DFE|nr:protein PMR5-like [Mercurialis annua]
MTLSGYSVNAVTRARYLGLTVLFLLLLVEVQLASSAIIMSMRKQQQQHKQQQQQYNRRPINGSNGCSLFVGSWVKDENYPLYQSSNCPLIDPQFNCQMFGRPDSGYLKYRWQPLDCELPRFNGVEFLMKMRGKTVMFVGDSLSRNQWESLLCLILAALPSSASTQISRGDPFSTFKFLDYGVSLSYYKAPYLVDIDMVQGKRILKLEEISGNGNVWRNANVLVFNTGHWWSHQGSLQGWDYMESGGTYYQDMDRLVALEKALRTWSNWVDSNIDAATTTVFFQSISPTHYDPNEWSDGATTSTTRNCYGETSPISGRRNAGAYPDQMRVVDDVLRDMHNPTYLLDITMLSELRKDCHPSIYNGDLSPEQRANPGRSADCSHWCLPGLPDTWNQLLYTALLF